MSVKCILTNQFDKSKLNDYIAKKATYYPNDLNDSSLIDSPLLVDVSDTINTGLQTAIGDTLAYVIQVFQDDTTKMQLAVGYTNGRIASRINKEGVWTDWIAAVAASFPMTFSINESGGLVMIYDNGIPEPTLLSFTISPETMSSPEDKKVYQYEEGMTWTDFINSTYNDSKFTLNWIYAQYNDKYISNSTTEAILSSDKIINNYNYISTTHRIESSFEIEDFRGMRVTYDFIPNMTWQDFVSSKYNDNSFSIEGESVLWGKFSVQTTENGYVFVQKNDLIIDTYYTANSIDPAVPV